MEPPSFLVYTGRQSASSTGWLVAGLDELVRLSCRGVEKSDFGLGVRFFCIEILKTRFITNRITQPIKPITIPANNLPINPRGGLLPLYEKTIGTI